MTVKTQKKEAIALVEKLLIALNEAEDDFVPVYNAVMSFLNALDRDVHLLGDGDIARLLLEYLRRRGKPASAAAGLVTAAAAMNPEYVAQ